MSVCLKDYFPIFSVKWSFICLVCFLGVFFVFLDWSSVFRNKSTVFEILFVITFPFYWFYLTSLWRFASFYNAELFILQRSFFNFSVLLSKFWVIVKFFLLQNYLKIFLRIPLSFHFLKYLTLCIVGSFSCCSIRD